MRPLQIGSYVRLGCNCNESGRAYSIIESAPAKLHKRGLVSLFASEKAHLDRYERKRWEKPGSPACARYKSSAFFRRVKFHPLPFDVCV